MSVILSGLCDGPDVTPFMYTVMCVKQKGQTLMCEKTCLELNELP